MRRVIFCMLIYIVCLFSSGCVMHTVLRNHGLPHPHSEITAPTLCLYYGGFRLESEQYKKPAVNLLCFEFIGTTKINDEPIDWNKWMGYGDIRRHIDQKAWEIEYAPDSKSDPPDRRFSCITYGQSAAGVY